MSSANPAPLQGIRVADFSAGIAGPHAALLLAHHGAEVTKIEPLEGDWSRRLGASAGGQSPFSTYYNRGKCSIALDLKTPEGREIAHQIVRKADIVVESFRPSVMARLGLGTDDLRRTRPELICLSISGFGQQGPHAMLPATDTVIQGFSGLMSMNHGADGEPQRFPLILVDVVSGLYAAQAVMAAVVRRLRFGQGATIDCSLLQSALALQAPNLVKHEFERGRPTVMYVPLGVLRTRDGHVSISVNRDAHFSAFCRAMERAELATDPRFQTLPGRIAHEATLMQTIRQAFVERDTEDWCRRLQEAEILHARIRTYDEVLADPVLAAQGAFAWIEQPGVPGVLPMPAIPGAGVEAASAWVAPGVGSHSRQVLAALGFAPTAVEDLIARGVVHAPP